MFLYDFFLEMTMNNFPIDQHHAKDDHSLPIYTFPANRMFPSTLIFTNYWKNTPLVFLTSNLAYFQTDLQRQISTKQISTKQYMEENVSRDG